MHVCSPESFTSQIIHQTQYVHVVHVAKHSLVFEPVLAYKNNVLKPTVHTLAYILLLLFGIKLEQTPISIAYREVEPCITILSSNLLKESLGKYL